MILHIYDSFIYVCRQSPSACRANEYERKALLRRYIAAVQELCSFGPLRECLDSLAEQSDAIHYVRGLLRCRPDSQLTFNEDYIVRNTRVIVEGAGAEEVNGEYTYKGIKFYSGLFTRAGVYEDKPVTFTLYKCNVHSNGYQWFISITPEGQQPGTNHDTDFYYALCKASMELLPPVTWGTLQVPAVSKSPAPTVRCESPILPDMPDSLFRLIDTAAIAATMVDESDSSSRDDDLSSMLPDDLLNDDRQMDDSLSNTPLGSPHNNHRPRDYD